MLTPNTPSEEILGRFILDGFRALGLEVEDDEEAQFPGSDD